jgi:long-chain acyl-CoA synthetase
MSVTDPPKLSSLPALLEHFAIEAPERDAACDDAESFTYGELMRAVERTAAALRESGIGPGDRVAFLGAPGVPFWVSLLGVMRLGAVWLGLNPAHTPRELRHVLNDARPRLCLVDAKATPASRQSLHDALEHGSAITLVELRPRVAGLIGSLEALDALPTTTDASSTELAALHVSLLVYTSGSTGAPKGALLTATGLIENGWWIARRMRFEPVRALVNLPVNHIGCIGDLCATVLTAGGTLVFMDRFDAHRTVAWIAEKRLTWLGQVPAQFQLMVSQGGLQLEHLRGVRYLLWGGAAMPEPLVRFFLASPAQIFGSYGLTECSGTITITEPGAQLDELVASVGRPVDDTFLRIVDEQGRSVPAGCDGEIQLSGPHVFAGYLGQPEASRRCMTADGWLRTGDLGTLDANGNLHLLGRTSEMFKSGGYNVYPREVETVVESLAGVELCAVVSVPDALWSEIGIAFVQGDPARLTGELLHAHCTSQLARYKIPKRFIVQPSLPLLPVGKVDKQKLRVAVLQGSA